MDKSGLMHHLACRSSDIGGYCLLPGDPGRCEYIASFLDGAELKASNREYVTYTGTLSGERVSVVSTGIGGPSAAIAIEELCKLGAHTLIRVGTCGGIDLDVRGGDIVIATGSVRQEGLTREYAPIEYPAVPDFQVLSSLVCAAEKTKLNWHAGVVQSKDSFYGQHEPERMPVASVLLNKWEAYKRLGVLASEMESAALFVVSAALNARSGAIFNVVWNQERRAKGLEDPEGLDTGDAVKIAVDALRVLIEQDKKRK